jgi:hypothetical protein
MDRTSWKPKIYKATETVDYKAEEEGTSDGAKKGWLTRQRGGSAEEPKKDFVPIDWAGQVGATKSEADQDKASDLMDKYYELVNEPMMDLPEDGSAMEERKAIHAKGVADFKAYLESSGSATVNQDVRDILEDENYHSLNKMLTKEEPETQSSRDKEFYDQSTQNTLDTLNQSKVNGFPFFSYVGQPKQLISDGKGGIILYGMKRNPNSIRRVDIKYDEGRDTYTVSFMSNRNKPKGEYNDVYFDQLGGLIAGNKGLGVESYAKENIDTVDDYFDYVDEEPDERKCEFCGAKINSLFNKKYMIDHVNSVHDAGLNPTDGQKLNKTFPSWGESYATEDDYKYDWDQLTSLAQKALSDIGYDKESWDSEPEDIRKEMEKVAYSEENWKEVANKFYKEELNKGKKNGGEAMYGYGSATGRMSPVEAWNQGADVYGDMGYDQSLRNPIFQDFRGLKWNELPTDIQEAWKSELGYYTQGEGLVDNIEKQLNRFGVNLDRDPEQVEESSYKNWTGGGAEKEIGKWIKSGVNQGKPNYGNYTNEEWEMVHQEEDATDSMHSSIGSSNREADYYPSRDIINNDVPAKNQGQSWQKGGEADPCWKGYKQIGMKDKNGKQVPNCVPNASESYLVEWGYDLDYDFAEIDNLEDAKQKAIDKGGNVYLDNTLVYSVIPSKKIDPANDKSGFVLANHLMNVESKAKANEEGVNDWWDRVTTDGSDLDRMWRGTHFNEIPIEQQNHYFSLYMEELSASKYGDHMAMHNATDFSHPAMYKYDADLADPNKTDNMPYYAGWQVEDSLHSGNTTNPFAIQNDTISTDDDPFNNGYGFGFDYDSRTMAGESVLEKVHVDGWEFSVIDDGYGGGSFGSTPNAGLLEVGIFAPKSGSKTMIGDSAIKGWLTQEEVDDLKRTFEVDPVMAYRRIGGDWEEDWQKGFESKASEDFTNPYPNILSGTMPREQSPSERAWTTSDEDDWDNKLTHEEKKSKLEKLGYTQAESLATSRYYDLPHAVKEALFYTDKPNELDHFKLFDEPLPYGFESKASEGFDQGLYGYVDAKCKTCGIEFDSIPDMDDHYAMNSDHVSNLNDLDSDIPNSD